MGADALADFLRALSWDGALAFECIAVPEGDARVDVAGAQLALELALMDADRGDAIDSDSVDALALSRMQSKVDLILRLLAYTLQRDTLKALPHMVRLNEYGLAWDGAPNFVSGTAVMLSTGLDNSTVLRLPARITVVTTSGTTRTVALFEVMPDTLRESLRRYVFKAHRRQRAQVQKVTPLRRL